MVVVSGGSCHGGVGGAWLVLFSLKVIVRVAVEFPHWSI